jgi:hypothetical protein
MKYDKKSLYNGLSLTKIYLESCGVLKIAHLKILSLIKLDKDHVNLLITSMVQL